MTADQAQAMIDAINRLAAAAELIFNVPSVGQLSALFGAGFITPMTLYIAAAMVGKLVNFWRN